MWETHITAFGTIRASDGAYLLVAVKLKDPSPYRGMICTVINKTGDIMTHRRTRSWRFDRLWTRSFTWFKIYHYFTGLLLYGSANHGTFRWNRSVKAPLPNYPERYEYSPIVVRL